MQLAGRMRPAHLKKNLDFYRNIKEFGLFLHKHKFLLRYFFSFFQCGPQELNLSLMRPASHFEFETPDV